MNTLCNGICYMRGGVSTKRWNMAGIFCKEKSLNFTHQDLCACIASTFLFSLTLAPTYTQNISIRKIDKRK